MTEQIYNYFEQELLFIRRAARDFAARHPDPARRLMIEEIPSPDPHVERLIEAFAFLAARIHMRLDDGFPELTDALLGILQPHYLVPIPSLTIVQMLPDRQKAAPESGIPVGRGTMLTSWPPPISERESKPEDAVPCKFRTTMDVVVWPLAVTAVDMPALGPAEMARAPTTRSAIRLTLRTTDNSPLRAHRFERLTFYLDSQPASYKLHEALCRDSCDVLIKQGGAPIERLRSVRVQERGFEPEAAILDIRWGIERAHGLLQEYFAFPQKFLFVSVEGLDTRHLSEVGNEFEIWLLLNQNWSELSNQIGPENFRLGCTPAANYFPMDLEPIGIQGQRVTQHHVQAMHRARKSFEVLTIESVVASVAGSIEQTEFRPLYAIHHGDQKNREHAYWYLQRRESLAKDVAGTDVFLSLVDPAFQPAALERFEVLHVRAICSNRDQPLRLKLNDPSKRGDFQVEKQPDLESVRSLMDKPTPTFRPPLAGESRWRLVSSLCLNHLSLLDDRRPEGSGKPSVALSSLRETLALYDYVRSPATEQRVEGLASVHAGRKTRVLPELGPVRGVEVELGFDETKFTGSSAFLFASVLERYLALHTTINSFTATVARLSNRDRLLKRWEPRIGTKVIL